MNSMILRSLELDDLVVERSSTGRTIIARAFTYGVPYMVSDDGGQTFYEEVWRAGVFDNDLRQRANKVPLYVTHDRQAIPIGSMSQSEADPQAFTFRAKINNGPRGDEVLELIGDDVLSGVSVGARPVNNRAYGKGGVERVQALLVEISLTPHAQMVDGKVLAVRALIPSEPPTTPNLDAARAYLTNLTRP